MAHKNYTSDERRHMIVTAFLVAIQNDQNRWMTLAEIGRRVGLSRSPHLRNLVLGMVQNDELIMRECERGGRWPGYEYMLPNGSFEEPKKGRTISFNNNGKPAGQLELSRRS